MMCCCPSLKTEERGQRGHRSWQRFPQVAMATVVWWPQVVMEVWPHRWLDVRVNHMEMHVRYERVCVRRTRGDIVWLMW